MLSNLEGTVLLRSYKATSPSTKSISSLTATPSAKSISSLTATPSATSTHW